MEKITVIWSQFCFGKNIAVTHKKNLFSEFLSHWKTEQGKEATFCTTMLYSN